MFEERYFVSKLATKWFSPKLKNFYNFMYSTTVMVYNTLYNNGVSKNGIVFLPL